MPRKRTTLSPRKNPAAVALGRLGGKARLVKMTREQRLEISRKAGLTGGRGRPKQKVKGDG